MLDTGGRQKRARRLPAWLNDAGVEGLPSTAAAAAAAAAAHAAGDGAAASAAPEQQEQPQQAWQPGSASPAGQPQQQRTHLAARLEAAEADDRDVSQGNSGGASPRGRTAAGLQQQQQQFVQFLLGQQQQPPMHMQQGFQHASRSRPPQAPLPPQQPPQQQQRRRGPVNQWRPGMALASMPVVGLQQQQQQHVAQPAGLAGAAGLPHPAGLPPLQPPHSKPRQQQQQQLTRAAASSDSGTAAAAAAAAAGGQRAGASSSSAEAAPWLKLLSCEVQPGGRCLALKLLLAGAVYSGRLTLADHPQPAGAAGAAGASCSAMQQQQQPGSGAQQDLQVVDAACMAALIALANERVGACVLCRLPFAQQQGAALAAAAPGQGTCAAAQPPQQQQQEAGPAAEPAAEPQVAGAGVQLSIKQEPGSSQPGAEADTRQQQQQQQQQQDSARPPDEPPQQEQQPKPPFAALPQAPEQQQQQPGPASTPGLGPPVAVEVLGRCSLALHADCAAWADAQAQQPPAAAGAAAAAAKTGSSSSRMTPQRLLLSLSTHCNSCKQLGASITCAAAGCSRAFHLGCARAADCLLQEARHVCWCAEHKQQAPALPPEQQQQEQQQQQQQPGTAAEALELALPHAAAAGGGAASRLQHGLQPVDVKLEQQAEQQAEHASGLLSPEPSKPGGIVPSPSFAAALVLQQMRGDQSAEALPALPGGQQQQEWPSGVSTSRRLRLPLPPELPQLQQLQPGGGRGGGGGWPAPPSHQAAAGLFGHTAEAVRQAHRQQRQARGGGDVLPAADVLSGSYPQHGTRGGGSTALQQLMQQTAAGSLLSAARPPLMTAAASAAAAAAADAAHAAAAAAAAAAQAAWDEGRLQQQHLQPGAARPGPLGGFVSAFAQAAQQVQFEGARPAPASPAAAAAAAAAATEHPVLVVPRVRARKYVHA